MTFCILLICALIAQHIFRCIFLVIFFGASFERYFSIIILLLRKVNDRRKLHKRKGNWFPCLGQTYLLLTEQSAMTVMKCYLRSVQIKFSLYKDLFLFSKFHYQKSSVIRH